MYVVIATVFQSKQMSSSTQYYLTPCRQLSLSIRFSSNFTARLRIVFANTTAAPAQFSLFAQLSSIKLRKIKGLYGHARG